jgi:Domain of unknown function (DUF4126)
MNVLENLGLALGLASLAGINLYLTVLLAGGMIHFNLLHLADKHAELSVLAHPWVLGVAAVLFAIEFVADKVPWVDTAWDSLHTFIRPLGGTLLGIQALGQLSPEAQVIAGLLAGGAALTTHTAKSGARLIVNHSPEPVSNVALSVTEDVGVVGGIALIALHPVVAFGVFTVILTVLWIVIPRIFRLARRSFGWIQGKLTGQDEALVPHANQPAR